jgi:hypothetical protein
LRWHTTPLNRNFESNQVERLDEQGWLQNTATEIGPVHNSKSDVIGVGDESTKAES